MQLGKCPNHLFKRVSLINGGPRVFDRKLLAIDNTDSTFRAANVNGQKRHKLFTYLD